PYNSGGERFHSLVQKLSSTVSDNPQQVRLLSDITDTIEQWQSNVTQPTIELRQEIGDVQTMNDMAALIRQAKGKVYFDKFRSQMGTFIQREETLLIERQERTRVSTDIDEIRQLNGWVEHTYKVIDQARALVLSAVNMETGMRGFLLAGHDDFLEPFNQGKSDFYTLFDKLSQTVSDNPQQVKRLSEAKQTI
ncbi:CHASE3 domain-containing protein, partial [Vibrio rotiferianus]